MEALEYTIDFVKTCNLKMLYLVFGTKVCITHLNLLFSNALFTHFYDAIVIHSYDVNWSSVFLHYDRSSWTTFMLRCEITTFKLKKTTFVVYLIVLSPMWSWALPFFYVKIIQMQVRWSTRGMFICYLLFIVYWMVTNLWLIFKLDTTPNLFIIKKQLYF
jgi:hypothetical protein